MEKHEKVGTDLIGKQVELEETIVLKFNNLKGIKVLKKMVIEVEKNLLEKK